MLSSILLIMFVAVNLVLFILFLLACVFAHKQSPVQSQQKSNGGRVPTEGSTEQRIHPNGYRFSAAIMHADDEHFSVRYSSEDRFYTERRGSSGSATGGNINTNFIPDDRFSEQTTDGGKNRAEHATEIAESRAAISKRRVVESLAPAEDQAEDGPDYVNISQLTNPDQTNPEYVNITDINRPNPDAATGDEGECYVNIPFRRPPSYFDLFTSDVHRQMNKLKRLSQQMTANLFSQAAH